jgi:hypothetical protein
MSREISPDRKSLYTVGLVVSIIGGLMFASTIFSAIANFGDFTDFTGRARSMGFRAFGGMGLLVVGTMLRNLAARGAAGSGLRLDPEGARRDLEPWSRMSGGMTKDALDEMGVDVPKIVDSLTGRDASSSSNVEPTAAGETLEQRLRGLHALYKDGILSEEEYRREKQEILDRE